MSIIANETYFKITDDSQDAYNVQIIERSFVLLESTPVIVNFQSEFENQFIYETAGENIINQKAVVIVNGLVVHADNTDVSHIGKVVGIASQSVTAGDTVKILRSGVMTGMSLSIDNDYFVGTSGDITDILPSGSVMMQKIGFAVDVSNLLVNIEEPILLA